MSDVVVNYGTYLGQSNAILYWTYRDKCTKLPITPLNPVVRLHLPDDTQVTFADTSVAGADEITPIRDNDGTVTGTPGKYYVIIGSVDPVGPTSTTAPYYYLSTDFTWEAEETLDSRICFVVAPTPTPSPSTAPSDVGIYSISSNVDTIEPAEYFCAYLGRPGLWDVSRTNGRLPIIIPEEDLRRVNFTRHDIITCRFDGEDMDIAGIDYEHEHAVEQGEFRIYTRHSRQHAHMLSMELKRLIQKLRVDPYGPNLDSIGRNFLKVTRIGKTEDTTRAYWHRTVNVELISRWRSIFTEDP